MVGWGGIGVKRSFVQWVIDNLLQVTVTHRLSQTMMVIVPNGVARLS
jgi:hypothetical protein